MVELLAPGPLQVERLPSGRRKLLRDLNLRIDREPLTVPAGFITDYSSWPRLLPGPSWHRIDVAGVVHDALFQWGRWGKGGRLVSYVEANRVWYKVARAGSNGASAGPVWGWLGRVGLFVGAWPVWLQYRSVG